MGGCAHTKNGPWESKLGSGDSPAIRMVLKDPPLLGTTPAGDRIFLGGFSGLRYLGKSKDGRLRFITLTDRGPNADEVKVKSADGQKLEKRPFLLPGYQPRFIYLLGDPATGTLTIERQVLLRRPDGKTLSGLPQKTGQESAVSTTGEALPLDPYGMDLEGIAPAADGSYWIVEEYGPTLARFSAEGKLLETMKPGNGLPKVFEQRRNNRGFEGMAILGNRLYAIIQSPLDNPRSEKEKNSKRSSVVRIAEVDLAGRRTLGQFAYLLEGGDRIGDIAIEGPRNLLVIEQDGKGYRRVFRANLENATNLQLLTDRVVGPAGTLESMNKEALAEAGILPATKEEVIDLDGAGVKESKVEGIDLVEDSLAFVIDNDFGLNGDWDQATGKVGFKDEPSAIYLFPAGSWKR